MAARLEPQLSAARRTRVKICGIGNGADADAAVAYGADAIGLVFAGGPRAVQPQAAGGIVANLPPFVSAVGLFLDPAPAWVETVLAAVSLDLLQFHGKETPGFCGRFGLPYLKALGVGGIGDLEAEIGRWPDAAGVLLDSHAPGQRGGSGRRFDWTVIPPRARARIILAGGLTPANVGAAVLAIRPWAVDVSSGVEARPGVKDHHKLERFLAEVRHADLEGLEHR